MPKIIKYIKQIENSCLCSWPTSVKVLSNLLATLVEENKSRAQSLLHQFFSSPLSTEQIRICNTIDHMVEDHKNMLYLINYLNSIIQDEYDLPTNSALATALAAFFSVYDIYYQALSPLLQKTLPCKRDYWSSAVNQYNKTLPTDIYTYRLDDTFLKQHTAKILELCKHDPNGEIFPILLSYMDYKSDEEAREDLITAFIHLDPCIQKNIVHKSFCNIEKESPCIEKSDKLFLINILPYLDEQDRNTSVHLILKDIDPYKDYSLYVAIAANYAYIDTNERLQFFDVLMTFMEIRLYYDYVIYLVFPELTTSEQDGILNRLLQKTNSNKETVCGPAYLTLSIIYPYLNTDMKMCVLKNLSSVLSSDKEYNSDHIGAIFNIYPHLDVTLRNEMVSLLLLIINNTSTDNCYWLNNILFKDMCIHQTNPLIDDIIKKIINTGYQSADHIFSQLFSSTLPTEYEFNRVHSIISTIFTEFYQKNLSADPDTYALELEAWSSLISKGVDNGNQLLLSLIPIIYPHVSEQIKKNLRNSLDKALCHLNIRVAQYAMSIYINIFKLLNNEEKSRFIAYIFSTTPDKNKPYLTTKCDYYSKLIVSLKQFFQVTCSVSDTINLGIVLKCTLDNPKLLSHSANSYVQLLFSEWYHTHQSHNIISQHLPSEVSTIIMKY